MTRCYLLRSAHCGRLDVDSYVTASLFDLRQQRTFTHGDLIATGCSHTTDDSHTPRWWWLVQLAVAVTPRAFTTTPQFRTTLPVVRCGLPVGCPHLPRYSCLACSVTRFTRLRLVTLLIPSYLVPRPTAHVDCCVPVDSPCYRLRCHCNWTVVGFSLHALLHTFPLRVHLTGPVDSTHCPVYDHCRLLIYHCWCIPSVFGLR